jgi:thymidylate synthase
MFRTISSRNVNHALETGLHHLLHEGELTSSRNGPVLVAPGPVITAYKKPTERVLWCPWRDANPFFHLFESMWMLAGRNDTATLKPLVPRMQDFSDDNATLNGAYGFRWREYFGYDQLKEAAKLLLKDPSTRRVVISMWNAATDLELNPPQFTSDLTNQGSKDLPCNTHIYFDASRGKLDMTVCNRSNDVIWGAYGANSVHMSFLHEWLAHASGLPLGIYYQMSNNYHIYVDRPDVQRLIHCPVNTPRPQWRVKYSPLDQYRLHPENAPRDLLIGEEWRAAFGFLDEMNDWCENGGWLDAPVYQFTKAVLNPMMAAHKLHKNGDTEAAVARLRIAEHSDWKSAGIEWLLRRMPIKHTNKAAV